MIYNELYKKRKKINYDIINGKYSNIRIFSIFLSMIFYCLIPFLHYNKKQAILFDIINYKIYVFKYIIYPNDFVLFCILILICLILLFLITLLYGRLWCGYLCPQTSMLYIFNLLSIFFEGNRNNRIKIDNKLFNFYNIFIKTMKHLLFILFLFIFSLIFVGYFVPILSLFKNLFIFNINNLSFFIIILITSILYFESIFLGEQFCFLICPYARFQNIMYDESTTIVKYDFFRGEPRKSKNKNFNFGDCINCMQCVYSCPTGIDIRDGTQIECINCGVCVDACNAVMIKINKNKDLISYQKDYNITKFMDIFLKNKIILFSFIFLFFFFIFFYLLKNRVDLDFVVHRNQYTLCNKLDNNVIENNYIMKMINKTNNNIFCNINVYSYKNMIDINYIGPLEFLLYPDCINYIYVKINSIINKNINNNFYTIIFDIKYVKNNFNISLKKEINFFVF
jgi:cytochrome c oxidase accessory protein FixG